LNIVQVGAELFHAHYW